MTGAGNLTRVFSGVKSLVDGGAGFFKRCNVSLS